MRNKFKGLFQILLLILGLSFAIYPLYYNKTQLTKVYNIYGKAIRDKQPNLVLKVPLFVGSNLDEYTIKSFLNKYSYFKFDLTKAEYTVEKNRLFFKLNTSFEYVLTKEQEEFVNSEVKSIIKTLDLDNKSDYEKAFIIYNWVIDNLSYDLNYYSSYDALKNGKAVCQGYADLFNRLAREAGLNSIVTVGELKRGNKSEPHAWNVVEIDNVWYHVDATAGDSIGDLRYIYFMIPYYQLYYTHTLDPVYPPSDTSLTDVIQDTNLLNKFGKLRIDYNVYNIKSHDILVKEIIKLSNKRKTVMRFYSNNTINVNDINRNLQKYSIRIKAIVEPITLNINGDKNICIQSTLQK